jgi:hypothetical protein
MKTKKITIAITLLLMISVSNISAQDRHFSESHGSTLNLGLGVGGYSSYYGSIGHTLPILNVNYEFDVARNFTLAPFLTFYTYRNDDAHYRESIIPVGVKGSYYLYKAFQAGSDWDFYLAGSIGFAIRNSTWDDGYSGDTYYKDVSPLFLDLHLGAEYHLSSKVGLFLDLSTGVSTLGLSFR